MRLTAIYHVSSDAASIEARARSLAIEQSVEMPLEAIDDLSVLSDIVGEVRGISDIGDGQFEVRIGLAVATVGGDAGQLLNMLFGNSSLQPDVVLADAELPDRLKARFPGPNHGIRAMRARVGAGVRALTCAAIKPQGLPADRLARLAGQFAMGGVDYIKDDHGLADQSFSPFAARVVACAAAVRAAWSETGHRTRYIPSLSGNLDQLRAEISIARDAGIDTVMVAPMLAGASNVQALVGGNPDMAFLAHPTLAGAARIAPEWLFGKFFPLIGADLVVFPTYGGRFGYSRKTCRDLAANSRTGNAVPVPAGGMTLARIAEKLDFYGPDTMLLIGGNLLLARENIARETTKFTTAVANHAYG
jgi:ribulose-bisphosphate carboxylase large chain